MDWLCVLAEIKTRPMPIELPFADIRTLLLKADKYWPYDTPGPNLEWFLHEDACVPSALVTATARIPRFPCSDKAYPLMGTVDIFAGTKANEQRVLLYNLRLPRREEHVTEMFCRLLSAVRQQTGTIQIDVNGAIIHPVSWRQEQEQDIYALH